MLTAILTARPFISSLVITGIIFGLIGFGYWKGRSDGKIEQLKDSVQAYERREKIDADVQDDTPFELCLSLGGLRDQCDELRRLDQAAGGQ